MPLVNPLCVFCDVDTKDTQDVFQLYNVRVCKWCAPKFVDFLISEYKSQLFVQKKKAETT